MRLILVGDRAWGIPSRVFCENEGKGKDRIRQEGIA